MSSEKQHLRLDGIYPQRQQDFFMQRVKLPAGIISAPQALKVAQVAERAARGMVHLTTRGSIELHWLTREDLAPVAAELAAVGLVNRGACGGAVRGVVCGSLSAAAAPALEALVRRIHRHFTGNPRFENLPKKFKVAVEADATSRRHLIQDLGLVLAGCGEEGARFDVWAAGGLGREPQPGFLLMEGVAEERLVPLIETVASIYRAHTPPGKRLKHLVREIGQDEFRRRVLADPALAEELVAAPSLTGSLLPAPAEGTRLEARVFAGELPAAGLAELARIAELYCGGMLAVSGEQNIVLQAAAEGHVEELRQALAGAGFAGEDARQRVNLRVCPGTHECVMGLAPTREVAEAVLGVLGAQAKGWSWAISGCPNCCAQPQLAQAGIVAARMVNEPGGRTPRFDLYREGTGPFAEPVRQGLELPELLQAVRELG
jgi:ferredoxin-nitrite reductase